MEYTKICDCGSTATMSINFKTERKAKYGINDPNVEHMCKRCGDLALLEMRSYRNHIRKVYGSYDYNSNNSNKY